MESSSIAVHESSADAKSVMRLVEISAGYWLPRALHVVADLSVADALDEEPRLAAELAKEVGANADALDRVMRLLASHNYHLSSDHGVAVRRHANASSMLSGGRGAYGIVFNSHPRDE